MPAKELLPIFVRHDGEADDEVAAWLVDRAARFKREDRSEAPMPTRDEGFDSAASMADQRAIRRVMERREELSVLNQARMDQERTKLVRFYEYKERAARDKLSSVRETYERIAASIEPQIQRIVPVWAKDLENAERAANDLAADRERRLAQLHGREQVTAQHQVFTASYVEIVRKVDYEPGRQEA